MNTPMQSAARCWTLHGLFALSICLSSGCAAADAPAVLAVDRSIVTFDGLHPAQSPIFERVFVRDPLDLSGYAKLMIESAPSNYRHPNSQADDELVILTADQRDRFEKLISDTVGGSLRISNPFELAERAAPDVLTLWGTLVDINLHQEADGDQGEFILVIELRDSASQDTLVRAIHHYQTPLDATDPDGNFVKLKVVSEEIAQAITAGLTNVIDAR